jgi:putative ABC transport system permease protein
MFRSYFKIAFRNLIKNKGYTFINIAGLATGMAVALLIGLWIWDEVTYNQYHKNYDRLAQVWQHNVYNGVKGSQVSNPYVMAEEIRNNFGSDFKYVIAILLELRKQYLRWMKENSTRAVCTGSLRCSICSLSNY